MSYDIEKWKAALPKTISRLDQSITNFASAVRRGIGAAIKSPEAVDLLATSKARQKILAATAAGNVKIIETITDNFTEKLRDSTDLEGAKLAIRTLGRLSQEALLQQTNRESIAAIAYEEFRILEADNDATREIEDDWLSAFWAAAEKKSNSAIQTLLGKMLALEANCPGRFSAQTIFIISTLAPSDAMTFERICNISISLSDHCFIVIDKLAVDSSDLQPMLQYGVSYHDLISTESLGLLMQQSNLTFEKASKNNLMIGDQCVSFEPPREVDIMAFPFSKSGKEIRNLISIKPAEKFLSDFISYVKRLQT